MSPAVLVGLDNAGKDQPVGQIACVEVPSLVWVEQVSCGEFLDGTIVGEVVTD